VPAEVCDGHESPRPTSYGHDINRTTAGRPLRDDAFVTVLTLRRRRTVSTR
jgi:hypothetical protein